jgi:hypothetical protein
MPDTLPGGRHALAPHPDTPCAAVRALTVALERPTPALLTLHYRLDGDLAELRLPEPRSPVRADGLWQHTCFEAFIGQKSGDQTTGRAYWEYNFSPSGSWAAYQFNGYREGMAPLLKGAAPVISMRETRESLALSVAVDLSWIARATAAELVLGAAAVIETQTRGLSYWALKHPAGKPDFHQPESRIVPLD